MVIRFDDRLATYTFDMLNELELAYAVTVHKSQGSEFDAVVLALSDGLPRKLLTRNILYTAITRAKQLLVIVGQSRMMVAYMVNEQPEGQTVQRSEGKTASARQLPTTPEKFFTE
ncbi:MAG: ATP-binding domain-containing protein [Butyricicoccaceae bacterium]